jgi:holliday junction DNA helicase RuvA
MIEFLHGKLYKKDSSSAIIDVNGIGYLCHITTSTYERCPQSGELISLLIHFNVSENSQDLFGFYDEKERTMFRMLIGISGIGPKTAITMLSNISPQEFKKRIVSSEVSMLTAIPGIGPKTAKRIIVELKDKFIKMSDDDMPIEESSDIPAKIEASDALIALGYRFKDIQNILKSIIESEGPDNTENLIRKALKLLN